MDDLFFLIGLNEDAQGDGVNYVTNHEEWQAVLTTARANGWRPQGTILDYEFQYQLERASYEDIDQNFHTIIDQQIKDKCGRWSGGYLNPEYQVVTDDDARGLRKALQRAGAPLDLLIFLSHGAFRIAG